MDEILRGEFIKEIGKPKENGWCSAYIRYESPHGMIESRASGCFNALVQPGEWFLARGKWTTFRDREGKNIPTFGARIISPDFPVTEVGLHGFLTRAFADKNLGVSEASVQAFVKKHKGEGALKIEKDVKLLKELTSDPDAYFPQLLAAWNKRISGREPFRIMQAAKVKDTVAQVIFDYHRDAALEVIKRNPYELALIKGVPFDEVDKLGKYFKIPGDDDRRVNAAVEAVLSKGEDGHTCIPLSTLREELPIGDVEPRKLIESVVRVGGHVGSHENVTVAQPKHYFEAEKEIALNIAKLLARGRSVPLSERENTLSVAKEVLQSKPDFLRFDSIQQQAVLTCVSESIACLTGGPGTGKSTVTEAIVDTLEKVLSGPILLMAPSGKAAVRMSEATKREASTVHKGLGAKYDGFNTTFSYDMSKPLPAGCCVVVDEASMLDVKITASLLKALPEDGRILFVGDRHQLESVDAGYVLGDMLETVGPNGDRVPYAELVNVYRSDPTLDIADRAAEIKAGKFNVDIMTNELKGGIALIDVATDKIIANILRIFSEETRRMLKVNDLSEISVLCPQRTGTVGTHAINAALSKFLNAEGKEIKGLKNEGAKEPTPRLLDRVMMTVNDYELDIMNGDVGKIIEVKTKKDRQGVEKTTHVVVKLDLGGRIVTLPMGRAKSLVLAYAITGHKSQGSQYKSVVLPVSSEYRGLTRTLFYTEWTRSKSSVIVIGDREELASALTRVTAGTRRTMLPDLLKKVLTATPPKPMLIEQKAKVSPKKTSLPKFGLSIPKPSPIKEEPVSKPAGLKPFGFRVPAPKNSPSLSNDDEVEYGLKP